MGRDWDLAILATWRLIREPCALYPDFLAVRTWRVMMLHEGDFSVTV